VPTFRVINSKIALSKLIISATIDEARSSASYENKADPHFQQDGIAEKAFALGSSGSSTKQTAHLSIRGARCLGQCVWKTNAHSFRIQTVRALEIISWRHKGQNAYLALPHADVRSTTFVIEEACCLDITLGRPSERSPFRNRAVKLQSRAWNILPDGQRSLRSRAYQK